MNKKQPCSPYLERPLRKLEDAKQALQKPRRGRSPGNEDATSPTKSPNAVRRKAWQETKEAVGAYARNPCRATEVRVEAALGQVKHACAPCQPIKRSTGGRRQEDSET